MDMSIIERAVLVEEAHGLESKGISFADIGLIEESPWRIDPDLASRLNMAGESGMGYILFKMRLRDGREFASGAGSIMDFPGLPEGVQGRDVVEVYPHAGRELYGTSAWWRISPKTVVIHFVFPDSIDRDG